MPFYSVQVSHTLTVFAMCNTALMHCAPRLMSVAVLMVICASKNIDSDCFLLYAVQ